LTTDFASVDPRVLQKLVEDPTGTARKFTAWLKNGGNLLLPGPRILKVDRTRIFNPTEFIGAGWTIWRGPSDGNGLEGDEDQDRNALALSELDLNAVTFDDCIEDGEKVVKGEEKLLRLKAKSSIRRLDALTFHTIWENPELIPEHWKEQTDGNTTYRYFDGTVLRNPFGSRCVLCLYFWGGGWRWSYGWLGSGWYSFSPSAVLA